MALDDLTTILDIAELHKRIRECRKCSLCNSRTQAVPGKGTPDSDIMFIGESPDSEEDKEGIPFAGEPGKILDELLEFIKRTREQVFITHSVCCRSPDRSLNKNELMACGTYLCKHIMLIRPLVVCTLGEGPTGNMFRMLQLDKHLDTMDNMHGQAYISPVTGRMLLIPMYDPESALYDKGKKSILFRDMRKVQEASIPF